MMVLNLIHVSKRGPVIYHAQLHDYKFTVHDRLTVMLLDIHIKMTIQSGHIYSSAAHCEIFILNL